MNATGKNELRSRSTKAVAMVFSSTASMAVGRVLLFAGLARLLLPGEFGLFAACTSVLGILEVFTLLGVSPALIQRQELTARHVSSAFAGSVLLGAVASATVWLGAPGIAAVFKMPALAEILRTMAPLFFIRSLSMVGYGLAARAMNFRLITLTEISSFAVYAVVSLLLAWAGGGVWALITGYLAQHAFYSLLITWPVRCQFSLQMHRHEMRELAGFGSGISVANIATYLAVQGDNYVVGRVLGADSLGYYSRAYNLMQTAVTSVVNTLDQVLFPGLAKIQSDQAALAGTLRLSTVFVWLVYLPGSALMVVCAPDVITVLLGEKWLPMTNTFRLLACGLVFRAGCKMAATILMVRGRAGALATTQVLYAVLVIAGAAGGTTFGIEGVAVGVLAALAVNYALVNLLGFRALGAEARTGTLVGGLLAGLLLGALTMMTAYGVQSVAWQLGLPPVLRLFCTGAACGAVWLAALPRLLQVLPCAETAAFWSKLRQVVAERWRKLTGRISGQNRLRPTLAEA